MTIKQVGGVFGRNPSYNNVEVQSLSINGVDVTSSITGLGTISTQDADSVNIDGGAIDGVTLGTNSAITEAQIDDININGSDIDFNSLGRVGLSSSDLHLGTGVCGLRFYDAGPAILPRQADGTGNDGAIDLGGSSGLAGRFDTVFAVNTTISTSDQNEKRDIELLSDAERRVAAACKALIRKYRWVNMVEKKGDNARIHVGIIAQDLKAAFEAEGLDASRYAMFCEDTWTDEATGQTKSMMGVRYSELFAFIISTL